MSSHEIALITAAAAKGHAYVRTTLVSLEATAAAAAEEDPEIAASEPPDFFDDIRVILLEKENLQQAQESLINHPESEVETTSQVQEDTWTMLCYLILMGPTFLTRTQLLAKTWMPSLRSEFTSALTSFFKTSVLVFRLILPMPVLQV
jgi:hypothetical protein